MSRRQKRVVFLVPWRSDGAAREALWRVCRARWERLFPDWPIFEGPSDDGPFNRAQAINRAAAAAGDWDVAIVIDADVFLREDQVRAAVAKAIADQRPVWAHREWVGMNEAFTRRVIAGDVELDPDAIDVADGQLVERVNPLSWSCCIAIPVSAWNVLGGFDERFRGWGFEDGAFAAAVQGLTGYGRVEGPVFNLWHPRVPGSGRAGRDADGLLTVDAVRNARLGRRYMVAARRDHGQHDRVAAATPEEMERDIANLVRDDERLRSEVERLGMPDWSDWWPTLEELRSGFSPAGSVALVVHSGGIPDAWHERSLYLREALDSLNARLRAPAWERKVVYSDWGEDLLPDVQGIAHERGFYVVGPKHRQGYTGSMQAMWHYLAQRVTADFVFQSEDDFTIDRDVDVDAMMRVLGSRPHLVQLALLRAPFYPPELEPGTLLGHPADAFAARSDDAGRSWLEHRRFFTVNPMLMRRSLTRRPWPSGQHSEAVYGRLLFEDPAARAAFWGTGDSWCSHVGEIRAGDGY